MRKSTSDIVHGKAPSSVPALTFCSKLQWLTFETSNSQPWHGKVPVETDEDYGTALPEVTDALQGIWYMKDLEGSVSGACERSDCRIFGLGLG